MSAREFGDQLMRALAGRQASEDLTRLHRRIAELSESRGRYRLAWMSARQRARDVIQHWTSVTASVSSQRDHARSEWHRVAELFRSTRAERDEARAEVVRLGKALERAEHDNCGCLGYPLGVGEDEVTAAHARLRAALDEERIEPDPGCPAHGVHPHGGRRCLDCPACVGIGVRRTEGEAG